MEHTQNHALVFKLNEFFKYLLHRAHLLRKETKLKKIKTDIDASCIRL